MKGNPEVFWCHKCGKKVWALPEIIHDPKQLLCDDCRLLLEIKNKEKQLKNKMR